MKHAYLKPITLLLILATSVSAAEVTLKNGKKINGKVISEDATQITISETAGAETKIVKKEIASVNYEDTGSAEAPKAKGAATHDGFFLRMLGGYGAVQFNETPVLSNGTGTIKMSGPAGFFGFHLGYAITENLILMVALNGFAATELRPELNGQAATSTVGFGISNYGAGLSYYVMPINLYLSADVGTAKDQITVSGTKYDSEAGMGVNFQIGKEWWVSDNWGLGAAIFVHYSSMKDKSTTSLKPEITNTVFGLAFSATYN